ncbi:MAG: class I SAM-dependent methyltransferase [Hydrogenophaga sp.]|uniref:class I SAM-dependent methyltransferase n=1 Tax=Hydrogenophaga sp. TaxID=1904254 RepID=UPI001E112415|nr:class I SAM-dependent methyltransferase [Hydrogenophaga sp.]MBX3611444.1 class I SAM-dependent methyltransferase [Hydrogenophaga sp.]
MTDSLHSLSDWFDTAPGQYLLAWEQDRFDLAVADIFGFNALQLGLPQLATLRANRMPHRWLALPEVPDASPLNCALVADAAALPFPESSIDLLVLPHTLEFSADPHHVLREVERVLVPEGRVVISGFNPASLWGARQGRARLMQRMGIGWFGASRLYLPDAGAFIGPWRLRDWLRLLSLELESERYGCYRPAVHSDKWLQRYAWMDQAGERWWRILGAVYFVVAVKRVRGMRVLGPAWKPRRAPAAAPVSIANRH